jgi:NIPSNAP
MPTNENRIMYTLCIRYTLDPNRVKHFRAYVEHELAAIRNAGGKIVGYWLPTDFAGPTNIAYGLIDFPTLALYEQYRQALADDPLHQRNVDELVRNGAVINMERSIIERCGDGNQPLA